jgi:ABC-2 type transport system ATP-binding protein
MTPSDGLSVDVRELTKTFGTFTAVDRVSFGVRRGEIFGFLGPNGAGKSTTIRMLCGILKPTSGEGYVGGRSLDREPEEIKRVIGYMSQRFTLYNDLTVGENIDFHGGIRRLPPDLARERKAWVVEMAGLRGREGVLARELSGGWKQRLALGCAILHRPEIVFLDEPTASVDPASRRDFWDLIYALAEGGTTAFVTSHYLDEVERCHRLAIIFAGRVIALGSPRELKLALTGRETASLEEVFVAAVESGRRT